MTKALERVKQRLSPLKWRLVTAYHGGEREVRADGVAATVKTRHRMEHRQIANNNREAPVMERFADAVAPDDVVWDVGAHLGVYTLLAADKGAEVVAVEADPDMLPRLHDNIAANGAEGRVTVLNTFIGGGAMGPQQFAQNQWVDDAKRTVVPVSIDRVVADGAPPPSMLKIDVEGAEPYVLDGAADTLDDLRWVAVEVHTGEFDLYAERPCDGVVREQLVGAGFDVERVNEKANGAIYHLIGTRGERR